MSGSISEPPPPCVIWLALMRREQRANGLQLGHGFGRERLGPGQAAVPGIVPRAQRSAETHRLFRAAIHLNGGHMILKRRHPIMARYALPPAPPFSSFTQNTSRMVRRGFSPSRWIKATASSDAMIPEPSSCAPWPTSHESIWPPRTTISSGFSGPGFRRSRSPRGRPVRNARPSSSVTRTGRHG